MQKLKRLSKMKNPNVELVKQSGSKNMDGKTEHVHLSSDTLQKLLNDMNGSTAEKPLHAEFPSDREQYNNWYRNQARKSFRPKVDPQNTSIVLFPGQGSQFVGMGKNLLAYTHVKELYDQASTILGYDLLRLCLHGPKSELDKTVHCQPAVMVTSLAAVEKLKELYPKAVENCVGTAGFSVGEYAALVFAGAMTIEDALEVVKVRAEAMQEASEAIPSGMMTAFCGHDTKLNFALFAAREYCQKKLGMKNAVCQIANYLYPECKVIAGNDEALDFIEKNSRDFGIKRLKRLPVSGAFHTELMHPARAEVISRLRKMDLQKPLIPVHCNVTGSRYIQLSKMVDLLGKQIYKPVRWEQTMHILFSRDKGTNFPQVYELGPGRQLGTLLKMVNLKAYGQYKNVEV